MLSLVHGTIINGREYNASAVYWRSWRLVDTFANQTGERKSGIIGHELGEYNRADVLYVIGDKPPNPDPSPTELALMGRHTRPAASQRDLSPTFVDHGPHPLFSDAEVRC